MKRMRAWAPWLVLLIILFAGIRRVSFDVNITALLPPDLRESQALSIFLRSFAQRHELIAVIDAPDAAAAGNALAAAEKALGRRPDLVSMVVSKPALDTDPEAAAGFLAWSLLNLPPSEWERTRQELQPARINERITSVQESMTTGLGSADGLLGYDPLGLASPVFRSLTGSGAATSAFASPDGRRRICFLRAPGDFSGWRAASRWIEAVRAVMEPAVQAHGATLGLTGHPVFESEAAQIMQYDMSTSGLGSLLLTVGIFWAFYRSLRPMLLVAAALILTAVLTLAAGGLLLPGMNVMTAGFAGILIGLVVDYGILIHQESLSTAPDDEVRKRSRHGITAAAATTATAFFSLTVCTVPGISGLGFLVGIGIVIGAVIMLGPCSRWLMKQRPRPAAAASTTGTGWLASDRADPWLASAAATLALLCFAGLPWTPPWNACASMAAKPTKPCARPLPCSAGARGSNGCSAPKTTGPCRPSSRPQPRPSNGQRHPVPSTALRCRRSCGPTNHGGRRISHSPRHGSSAKPTACAPQSAMPATNPSHGPSPNE
jgi:predicted exporter